MTVNIVELSVKDNGKILNLSANTNAHWMMYLEIQEELTQMEIEEYEEEYFPLKVEDLVEMDELHPLAPIFSISSDGNIVLPEKLFRRINYLGRIGSVKKRRLWDHKHKSDWLNKKPKFSRYLEILRYAGVFSGYLEDLNDPKVKDSNVFPLGNPYFPRSSRKPLLKAGGIQLGYDQKGKLIAAHYCPNEDCGKNS